MSSLATTYPEHSTDKKLLVSFRLLLALYSIIPLCLLLQIFDSSFWNGYLQHNLPSSPKHFLLFQILFGTPHIIASAILLTSNNEYLKFYKTKILLMTIALAIFFGIGSQILSYRILYIMVASWTVFHVLKQQHGIARGICGLPEWAFNLLLWLSVSAGILIYVGIFLNKVLSSQQASWINLASGGLCICLLLSSILCQRYVKTRFGKAFMWANTLLVVSSFYLYNQQYYFLAILVPRLVHDATAYIFYVTHDYNRHHGHPRNLLYRYTSGLKLHIFIVLPLLSFSLAFLLQAYGNQVFNVITNFFFGVEIRKAITLGLLGYLALMHYYTEAFTWKNNSPYRKYIGFRK